MSFVVPMFLARFKFYTVDTGDQMGFVHMPPPVAEPAPYAEPPQELTPTNASVEEKHEPEAPLEEEDRPEATGSFWGGLGEN